MQSIKKWAARHPDRVNEVLESNPSYIFFRLLELPSEEGPLGALGIPMTPDYAIAVDPSAIPLGSLVYLDTTYPNDCKPLRRIVSAHDTGDAIHGPVRANLFFGTGNEAGKMAGKMKQKGQLWLIWPKDHPLTDIRY